MVKRNQIIHHSFLTKPRARIALLVPMTIAWMALLCYYKGTSIDKPKAIAPNTKKGKKSNKGKGQTGQKEGNYYY
jgi:hypothetical protein